MTLIDPEAPYVDYTSIEFPSDRLTIGACRRLYPDLFDVQGAPVPEDDDDQFVAAWEKDLQMRGLPISPRKTKADDFLPLLRAFPGDDDTILGLRRKHPDLIDVEGCGNIFHPCYQLSEEIINMLFTERTLARMAYQEAIGKPHELLKGVSAQDREGYISDLIEHYTRFGLTTGELEAKHLIRGFTAQAMAQALPPRESPGR